MNIEKSKLVYRKLGIEDIDVIIKYRMDFLREIQADDENIENERKLEKELYNYFIPAFKTNECICWIAEYKDQPVGFGMLIVQKIPGHLTFITGNQGYILNMYTIPEARGNGICKEILKIIIEESKKLKLEKLALHATNDGINIYKNYGFSDSYLPFFELKLS